MRLRQIALVARELEPVVEDLEAVFGLAEPFHDPGIDAFGLHNAVYPVGDTFLEVVSPIREGTTAGRLLERRGGDGGYMVIFQSDDLAEDRRRVEELKIRIVWEIAVEGAAAIHLHPRDVGAAIVSFDEMDPPASWRWAGPDWERRMHTEVVRRIAGVELQGEDAGALATRWSELLARPARWDGTASYEIALEEDRSAVLFLPADDGRGDGVGGVLLEAADPERAWSNARERNLPVEAETITLCGTRFRLV